MKWRVKVTLIVEAGSQEDAIEVADRIVPNDVVYSVERVEQATEPRDLASDLAEDRW